MTALLIVLLIVAYIAIGCVVARLAAGHYAWTFMYQHNAFWSYRQPIERPNGAHWFWGGLLGLLTGVLWPVAWMPLVRLPWAVGAEQRARIRLQDERIRELEKALEMDRS